MSRVRFGSLKRRREYVHDCRYHRYIVYHTLFPNNHDSTVRVHVHVLMNDLNLHSTGIIYLDKSMGIGEEA